MPHNITETIELQRLGIDAPNPIFYHYKWSGSFTPMDHQRSTAAYITQNPMSLVLNGIGTGKTLSTLWAADFLNQQNMTHTWIIVAPLSTVQTVWANTLFSHFPNRSYMVLSGSRAAKLRKLTNKVQFYIVNHDGFVTIKNALMARNDIHGIIFDEAQIMRNCKNIYSSVLDWVEAKRIAWRWLLTGTPTPNGPADAYALGKLIENPLASQYTFSNFRYRVMEKVGESYQWRPKANALATVTTVLSPSVRFKRADCVDLPPLTTIKVEAALTDAQKAAYERMRTELVMEYNEGKITAQNEAIKLLKLRQIASGIVYDTALNTTVHLPPKHKLAVAAELVEQSEGKALIFVDFVPTVEVVEAHMKKRYTVGIIRSSTPVRERNQIFTAFQNAPDPQVIIANPRTMSHGLTLTAATTVIWFSPTNSNETYEQACGRIERISQTKPMTVCQIISAPVEAKMYSRLEEKQNMQGLLLELLESKL